MRKFLNTLLQRNCTIKTEIRLNPLVNSLKRIHYLNNEYNLENTLKISKDRNNKNSSINKKIFKFSSCNLSQFLSNGRKIKYNIFIKENSRLEDLIFKEEIFEYVALKSKEMNEKDMITVLYKLESHTIIEAELKDFKFFICNVLEIQEKLKSEFAVVKFIQYFLKTYNNDLKKFLNPNSLLLENNKYDLNFSNINASLVNFALGNLMKIETNSNLKYVLDLLLMINFAENKIKKEFLEKIQIKFLQNVNLNLLNSPFDLKGIIDKEHSKSDIDMIEIDLNIFLLMNLVIYQDNKFPVDDTLLEIINYFELRLSDKHSLLSFWKQDLNKRPQIFKLKSKELMVFNLIYGFMNNWVKVFKTENKKQEDSKGNTTTRNEREINNEEETKENNNSLGIIEVNLISNKEQIETIEKLLKTIEQIILRNNKISKEAFLKKFNNDSIRYKETINRIEDIENKLIDRILSEMEKNI